MGAIVVILGISIAVITAYAFKPFAADPAMVVGVRVGLVVLIVAQGLGGAIIANGKIIDKDPLEMAPADLTPMSVALLLASALLGGYAFVALAAGLFGAKPRDIAV